MKLDKKIKNILLIITFISLLIRLVWFSAESGDYIYFLKPWVDNIRMLGGFKALAYNIGDYNVPYVFILTIISYLKCDPLIPIKIVSIIFDYIIAIYGFKIVKRLTNNINMSVICYGVLLFLPTLLINGAMWGQCDSIYTAFILISLYYLLDKKYKKSFIFFGISFAFKLQSVFILPLYVLVFFREKNIKIYHFLLIPLVNIIMCLPAIIMGRSISDVLMIYVNQTSTYTKLVMNFANIYSLIDGTKYGIMYNEIISKIGIILTMIIFFIMWLYVLTKKVKFNNEKIIAVGLWSIMIATYFLPRMHERYMFVADVLSVIWFMSYLKKPYMVLVINLVSTLSYFRFLFDFKFINLSYVSIIYFMFILLFTVYVMKMLGVEDGNRKNRVERRKLQKIS